MTDSQVSTEWALKTVYPCDCYGPNAPYCTIERPMPNCNRKQRREATVFIMDAPDTPVAKVATPEAAQRIVRAVNAHDAILEASVKLRGLLRDNPHIRIESDHIAFDVAFGEAAAALDAAIALAAGTSDEGAGS